VIKGFNAIDENRKKRLRAGDGAVMPHALITRNKDVRVEANFTATTLSTSALSALSVWSEQIEQAARVAIVRDTRSVGYMQCQRAYVPSRRRLAVFSG
jgi:hypothetical protein